MKKCWTSYRNLRTTSNCVPSLNGWADTKSINITDVCMLHFTSKMVIQKNLAGAITVFFNKESIEILKITKKINLQHKVRDQIQTYGTST